MHFVELKSLAEGAIFPCIINSSAENYSCRVGNTLVSFAKLHTFSLSEPRSSKEYENRQRRDSFNHTSSPILMYTAFPNCSKEYMQNEPNLWYLSCLLKRLLLYNLAVIISRSYCKDFFVQPLSLLLLMLP